MGYRRIPPEFFFAPSPRWLFRPKIGGRAGPPSPVAFGDTLSPKERGERLAFPCPSGGRWPAIAGRMRGARRFSPISCLSSRSRRLRSLRRRVLGRGRRHAFHLTACHSFRKTGRYARVAQTASNCRYWRCLKFEFRFLAESRVGRRAGKGRIAGIRARGCRRRVCPLPTFLG